MKNEKLSKLSALKMPGKRKELDMSELDMEEPSLDEELPGEGDPGEQEAASPAALDDVSDDELLAELKKRGLSAQLDKNGGDDGSNELDEMYS